jgi:DNA polymerase I-like protein with 3'-5' exonuclease and polymerase domains
MARWNVDVPTSEYYGPLPPNPRGVVSGDVGQVIRALEDADEIAIDSETTGLTVWRDLVLYWSVAWGNRRATLHKSMLPYFRDIFKDRRKKWIFANGKYDMHMFANMEGNGIEPPFSGRIYDTQVQHALLFDEQSHRLKDMAKHLLGWRWSDFQDTFGKITQDNPPWRLIARAEEENFPLLVEYAANDAWGTLGVYRDLRARLEQAQTHSLFRELPPYIETLWDLFHKIESPYTKVLWKYERNGIMVDTDKLRAFAPLAEREMEDIERKIAQHCGWMLTPSKSHELARYFFEQRKYEPIKWTKGGASGNRKPSADADFLEYAANELGDPVAKLTLQHRNVSKLYGTYIVGIGDLVDGRNRIHTRFNQDIARTGRLSSSDPNCFSPDTEVLTPAGWVRFDVYTPGTPVAQWENGVISFVKPTDYVKQKAERLVHIENQHIRLKVTEDHRCLLRHRKTGELRVFLGKDYPSDWQQLHAGWFSGGQTQLGEDLLRLVVAVQADGYIDQHGAIELSFTKTRKAKRIKSILDNLEAKYAHNPEDSLGRARFRLPKSPLVERVLELIGTEKVFGPWLLDLTEEELDIFCEEVFFWDGCWARRNHYSSDQPANATWVQTILAIRGKRAHFRIYEKANGEPNYQIDVTARDYSLTTNARKKTRAYGGDVYCVSVPSSYILVRTNGEICVTGQCQNIPNEERDKWGIRSCFIAPPGHDMLVCDYNQLEMRLLAAAAREQDMIDIFLRNWDIHMGNASMMMGIPYEELKEAKRIDKEVKEGSLAAAYLTERVLHCLHSRAAAKNIGFGLNYGMGAGKLANDLGITRMEAEAKIALYKKTYPAVTKFYTEAVAITQKTGYAFSILGRRRNLPGIASSRKDERARAERQAINMEIQGSAADVVKMAQLLLDRARLDIRYGCRPNLNIHDELIHECPKETAAEALAEIVQWMERPFFHDLDVPLTVAGGRGANWAVSK